MAKYNIRWQKRRRRIRWAPDFQFLFVFIFRLRSFFIVFDFICLFVLTLSIVLIKMLCLRQISRILLKFQWINFKRNRNTRNRQCERERKKTLHRFAIIFSCDGVALFMQLPSKKKMFKRKRNVTMMATNSLLLFYLLWLNSTEFTQLTSRRRFNSSFFFGRFVVV